MSSLFGVRAARGGWRTAAAVLMLLPCAALAGQATARFRPCQVTKVTDEMAVVRGRFTIVGGRYQWFSVYFGIYLPDGKPLKQPDGRDVMEYWNQIFPPGNVAEAVYDDVRVGIRRKTLEGATNLPKGQRTALSISCSLWNQSARKYIGDGWPARTTFTVTTNAAGKIVKMEAADANTTPVQPGAESPKALLQRMANAIKQRDVSLLASCFPHRTEVERIWAKGRSLQLVATYLEDDWRREVMRKFPRDGSQFVRPVLPDPLWLQDMEITKLAEKGFLSKPKDGEVRAWPPRMPGPPHVEDHKLILIDGRWYYKDWSFGKEDKQRKVGQEYTKLFEGSVAHYDRAARLLQQARTAKELKEKLDQR